MTVNVKVSSKDANSSQTWLGGQVLVMPSD